MADRLFLFLFLSLSYLCARSDAMSLWIDSKQVKQFLGASISVDIPVIENDQVTELLLNPNIEQYLPVINGTVNLVNLTWEAGPERKRYGYWFVELRSMQPEIMYDPLISIPLSGYVPFKQTVFQMAIPCTGRKSGVAPFIILLNINGYKDGKPLPGFPIKLHFRKHCKAFSKASCDKKCLNGGTCNQFGVCSCKKGFHGRFCELEDCLCVNNATCGSDRRCKCLDGYTGKYCGEALCRKGCANGGQCISPNKCWCPPGYHGDNCLLKSCTSHCANGGRCLDAKCVCPYGFQGSTCQEVLCSKSCGRHGICMGSDRCRCERGWHGKYCRKTFSVGFKWRKRDRDRRRQRKKLKRKKRTRKRKTA